MIPHCFQCNITEKYIFDRWKILPWDLKAIELLFFLWSLSTLTSSFSFIVHSCHDPSAVLGSPSKCTSFSSGLFLSTGFTSCWSTWCLENWFLLQWDWFTTLCCKCHSKQCKHKHIRWFGLSVSFRSSVLCSSKFYHRTFAIGTFHPPKA